MKITAAASMWICALFALICFGVSGNGFLSTSTIADPAERELSYGYVGFWAFLGVIAMAFGVLSWLIKQGKFGPVE